ncbi:SGD1 [[Candida] subhashii]|uniref:SGD1 n=1 Tax=[Candida] subhashii TaxID=561895 RepID=A0A8J5QLQ6_9ASCO|nr:SGD1 [[Candida] subhashii]KAG7662662.1 SGD1 [[Candida] subhashii]
MARRNYEDDNDGEPHSIRLPGSLLDQIRQKETKGDYNNADDDDRFSKFQSNKSSSKKRKGDAFVTRKDKRKQERELKKQKRIKKDVSSNSTKPPNNKQQVKSKHKSSKEDPMEALRKLKEKKSNATAKDEDPMEALRRLKEKKSKKNVSQEEDPLEALRKLKESKNKIKSASKTDDGFKIICEDDIEDDEISDFEDDFEDLEEGNDFDEEFDEEDIAEEDPMEALRKLKEKKSNSNNSSGIRIVREDDLQDDDISDLSEGQHENDSNDEEEEDDFEGFEDDDDEVGMEDFDDSEEELEEEEDPLAKLKALKEAKKSKKEKTEEKSTRPLSLREQELFKRDEDDIDYYAKKLGLKHGKKSKLNKADDDDIIGGLLDGLDLDFGSDAEVEVEEEEQGNFSDFNDHDDESDFEESGSEDEPKQKENPYVAPGTSQENESEDGAAPQRYIPPALRRKMAMESNAVSEEVIALRKSIKGPLNKLSEANINTIVNDLNSLFLSHPRHTLNEEITSIILDSIIQQGRLLDTFVYLHACVVVALYRLEGVEFGAHFIQTIVEKFEDYNKQESKTKECSNIVSLLSSIYLFQLVSSKLLYDLIKVLINNLNENNADLLLRLIRNSGNQMRSDDPSALKEIVLLINEKYSNLPKDQMTTRTQFLIETISTLKNNKMKVVNEANHQLSIRLKKFSATINNNKFNDPIQVSLEDIHNIETRGKWWLIGSAWKGHSTDASSTTTGQEDVNKAAMDDILDAAEPNWMELARAQRMNTDIRRAIFISIMSANDYIDAVTKLDKLALKRSQEREIPRVLMHCTVIEPTWNPYYGILANKLCDSHSYRKTFQFMLWDLVKELDGGSNDDDEDDNEGFGFDNEDEETKLKRILNLGRFYGYLLAEGTMPLHNLRTVNFLTASTDTTLFMEVLLVSFLDQIGKKSQKNAIGGGGVSKKSKMYEQKYDDRILVERLLKAKDQTTLLRGLQYFLQEKVKSSDIINGKKQTARVAWGVDAMFDIIDEILKDSE